MSGVMNLEILLGRGRSGAWRRRSLDRADPCVDASAFDRLSALPDKELTATLDAEMGVLRGMYSSLDEFIEWKRLEQDRDA